MAEFSARQPQIFIAPSNCLLQRPFDLTGEEPSIAAPTLLPQYYEGGRSNGDMTEKDDGRSTRRLERPSRRQKGIRSYRDIDARRLPQVTPVWFDYDRGTIRVNSAKGRVKVGNMKKGAPVAIAIMDPENPYRYVQIRGKVKHVTEEGADRHIDSLAKKYLGKDKYPFAKPGEVRVLFEIEPTSVSGNK